MWRRPSRVTRARSVCVRRCRGSKGNRNRLDLACIKHRVDIRAEVGEGGRGGGGGGGRLCCFAVELVRCDDMPQDWHGTLTRLREALKSSSSSRQSKWGNL
jgi:hypothetical protein